MPDYVPTSGAWQSDPVLQQLLQAFQHARATGTSGGVRAVNARGVAVAESQALQRYVEQNRPRLGIPPNYWPDPRTGGKTLYDPNQNAVRDVLLTGGAMAAGGYGLGAVLGGAGAAASAAPAAALGPSTPANIAATTAAAHAVPASLAVSGAGAASPWMTILNQLATPRGLLGAASLVPALTQLGHGGGATGGGSTALPTGNPFADLKVPEAPVYDPALANDAKAAYTVQQRRLAQGQPAFDALVAQAYGMTPTRYRAAAPEGVLETTQDPVSGAYTYQGPQFGRKA